MAKMKNRSPFDWDKVDQDDLSLPVADILEKYNIRDSYITYKFAEFLQNNFNKIGGNLKFTIASSSMSLYRKKYLKYWILQPPKEIIKQQINGFYGGRTEAFERGYIEDKNYYDINNKKFLGNI